MLEEFNLYELIGLLIGDGYLYYNEIQGVYYLEIVGDAVESKEYFIKVARFLEQRTNRKCLLKIKNESKGRSLRLYFNNKKFLHYLIFDLKLISKNKTFDAEIPTSLIFWKYMKHIIRGLFEADGSLYFSKGKREKPYYPRIEIKTSSYKIRDQVSISLRKKGFNANIRKCENEHTFAIYLSGFEMLKKWNSDIGFGSFKNYSKYLLWKRLNFYIPHISLQDRHNILFAEVAKRLRRSIL